MIEFLNWKLEVCIQLLETESLKCKHLEEDALIKIYISKSEWESSLFCLDWYDFIWFREPWATGRARELKGENGDRDGVQNEQKW